MALNNNQVASVLNEAFKISTGQEDVVALDLSNVVDIGNNADVLKEKESFTEALCAALVKNWFTDSSYRTEYSDPFFEDAERFGAIIQAISIDVPEVQRSHAWNDFKPVQGQPATAGVYELYLPVIDTKYYGKSVSWELPICITNEQWDTAFRDESGVRGLVEYVLLCVENALLCHMENMNNANRNHFIAEKVKYSQTPGAEGVHVINLVEAYQSSLPEPSDMEADEFLNDPEAMRFASECMKNYMGFMRKMTTLFNTDQKKRFTPTDRLVCQVLEMFENRMDRVALSNVFHDEYVKMPLHSSIPMWEGVGTIGDFSSVSTINVKLDADTTLEIPGVVALMADKWAIMHTIKSRRTTSVEFKPEDLVQYYNQFRDQYMNDLSMNAIVFVVQDYTVSGLNAGVKVTVLEQSDSVYGTAVSDIQDANMELIGNNFKGTSKWLATGSVASDWGAGNFIAIDFEDLPEEADKIMVGLEPSMGTGMVELTPDDTKSVFKIADKDLQELVIKTSIGSRTITQKFSLKGVTLASS